MEDCNTRITAEGQSEGVHPQKKVRPEHLFWTPDTGEDCSKYQFFWRKISRGGNEVFRCITLE